MGENKTEEKTLKNGLISVIIPLYNGERFIEETIHSVQKQTYDNLEVIVVDDCSTDGGPQLVEAMSQKDSRIQLIYLEENSGAAVARNRALDHASGQFVAFIDSDDYWESEKLEKQIQYMTTHHYAFTYTDFRLVDESGHILKDKTGVPASLSYSDLLKNTTIACSTVVIDRNMIGRFNMPLVRKGQDTATWLMLMRERGVKAYGVQEVLSNYRQVAGSISSNKLGALKRTWHTYRHLEGLSLIKASYYFTCYVFNAVRRRL